MTPRFPAKIVLALVALAGTTLVLIAATVLYFTGPTTKTVTERVWHERSCASLHHAHAKWICDGWDEAGYVTEAETLRTSAWERISGAITGSGDIDS